MSYKRDIENTSKAIFEGTGFYDMPKLNGTDIDIRQWQQDTGGVMTGFNYCKSYINKQVDTAIVGVHFFLDDYQFDRLWSRPESYISLLSNFKFVCSPDFSLYTDHPRAVQMYNHYRKQWVSAYLEHYGIKVIPTICWSDNKSYDWCFDGVPKNSTVAISTKGTQIDTLAKERFYAGYYQMLKRLEPKQIMLFGKNPGALDGNVIDMGYETSDMLRGKS